MSVSQEWFEKDFYEILGLKSDATDKEITKAYRLLAKKYHPDANSNDDSAAEKFKEVTEAYEVLGDEEKRKEYDYIRGMMSQGFPGGPGGPGPGGTNPFFTSVPNDGQTSDLNDLLSGLFSRMRKPATDFGATPSAPGAGFGASPSQSFDLETTANVSFYQALEGTVVPITFTDPNKTSSKEIKVKIPAGVNDGQKIKVSGRGLPNHKGKPGDLYVTVNVGEHPWFSRKGRTLLVKVPISFAESVIGTKVKVPTLDDPVTVKVPANTKNGTTMRVKGRGVEIGDQKGDLLITFEIADPTSLSEKEKQLYEELVKNQSTNPRAKYGLEK